MAPGSNNNHNNNNRQTGAKPKTKSSKKNSVPQEIVAPTRRDLQQQLNVLVDWATVSTNNNQQNLLLKPKNNRTPGEGTCYEIDNLTLQDNSRYIPVRPILRRNLLNEGSETNESHNTTVGVVIPTTPNSAIQTFRLNENNNNNNNQKHILNPISFNNNINNNSNNSQQSRAFRSSTSPLPSRVPDGASQNQLNLNKNSNQQTNLIKANVEDKLNQIQEYIKLTTSLISSVQYDNFNGPRPHSVQSISTNHSVTPVQTPSYEVDAQNRSMQTLKEQQQQLLRLQQSARQQLAEMEMVRNNATTVQQHSFDSVEQVQDNIGALMDRMRVLSTFIQNQNELGQLLGPDDGEEVLNEQYLLQNKFQELRQKKGQMQDLVSELQALNVEATRSFQEADTTTASSASSNTRIVPMDIERNVPIELTNIPATSAASANAVKTFDHSHLNGIASALPFKVENDTDNDENCEGGEEDRAVITQTADILNDKINEINAMKSQLRRLKEMMETVKLIEMKNGTSVDGDEENDEPEENNMDSGENTRSPSVISQLSDNQHHEHEAEMPEPQREQIHQRVEALHAMTRDLRDQAKSIALERDRLKQARNDIQHRRNNVAELQQQASSAGSDKLTNQVSSFIASASAHVPGPKEREQIALKAELDAKKKELENFAKMTETIKKNTEISRRNDSISNRKMSSVSSLESLRSLRSQSQQAPPIIPPPPTTSATNVSNNNSKNSGDSGVTDVFANAHAESGSYQSSSLRSFNMVPPMPDLCNRNERYKKAQVENQEPTNGPLPRDRSSPWPHIYPGTGTGAGPSSSNTGPQSPHFNPYTGSDIHERYPYNYPAYSNLLPPHTPTSADPLVFQHFMQTQQMLMNSITQCNQLLWIQQREINNLNNAVLLLQERILNNGTNNILLSEAHSSMNLRAESMPPNNNINSNLVYSRARSEQPSNLSLNTTSPFHSVLPNNNPNFTPTTSAQFPTSFNAPPGSSSSSSQFNINQQIQRNNTNITGNRNYRNLRHVNLTTNNATPNGTGGASSTCDQQQQSFFEEQNFLAQQQQQQHNEFQFNNNNNTNNNHLINNLATHPPLPPQSQSLHHQQQQQQHNLNNLNNNLNSNSNNLQNNLNLYSQPQQQQQQQHQQTQALNNQVLPGNRANNYWDNFRSYSRQNLLSSNSCKSNEESFTANSINNPIQRNNSSNINNYNNILDNNTGNNNKYQPNFNRNNSLSNVNQLNANPTTSAAGAELIQSQSQQQTQQHDQIHLQHHSHTHQLLNQSNSFELGELQFHTNPINLGLVNKTHPKASGNKKYPISLRYRDCNSIDGCNLYNRPNVTADSNCDLNLASASNYQHDSKSTSKLFEALKENVYQEVKNLITANESRPHFLIQLFRELQLISSDPLRQRTLQSIQDLYNRYIESTIHEENHVNNIGSNNLLTSNSTGSSNLNNSGLMSSTLDLGSQVVFNISNNNVRQQQQTQTDLTNYEFPAAHSTPLTNSANCSINNSNNEINNDFIPIPNSEIINIIMTDIVNVINSVDYINDSVLCKIIDLICNHAANVANNPILHQNGNNVLNKDEFLRHLNSWNRTDKDEFISNLENYLNNILLCSSSSSTLTSSNAVTVIQQAQGMTSYNNPIEAIIAPDSLVMSMSSSGEMTASEPNMTLSTLNTTATSSVVYSRGEFNATTEGSSEMDISGPSINPSSSTNYSSTTYDLAEADQIRDLNEPYMNNMNEDNVSANSGIEDDFNLF